MFDIATSLLGQLSLVEGRIVDFSEDGRVQVLSLDDNELISAVYLRTSSSASPEFGEGDIILLAVNRDKRGYILGILESCIQRTEDPRFHENSERTESGTAQEITQDIELIRGKREKSSHRS